MDTEADSDWGSERPEDKDFLSVPASECGMIGNDQAEADDAKEDGLVQCLDRVLFCMSKTEKYMGAFRDYIEGQDAESKCLYQWERYAGFYRLEKVAQELKDAVQHLRQVATPRKTPILPANITSLFFTTALGKSISVSTVACFVLETLNRKTDKFLEEIDQSSLSEVAKDTARYEIAHELQKIIQHTTATTQSIYAAFDLLLKVFHDTPRPKAPLFAPLFVPLFAPLFAEPTPIIPHADDKAESKVPEKSLRWAWKVFLTIFILVPVGAISIQQTTLWGMADMRTYLTKPIQDLHLESKHEIAALAQNITRVEEQANERSKKLEKMYEDIGSRIDLLWDALGPPNEDGKYFSKPKVENPDEQDDPVGFAQLREQFLNLKRFHQQEMVQLRRQVNFMDLRLTKQVDKLERER